MRTIVLALAVAVALTGCGGSHAPSSRDLVSAYLTRENAIEAQTQPSLVAVHQALVDFTKHRTSAATTRELAASAKTFERLRARLAKRDPPPQAAKLRRLLLQVVSREEALVNELHQLAVFEPKFATTLRPLATANAATQSRLRSLKSRAAIAATIRSYRTVVRQTLRRLQLLHPPALERPLFQAQVDRLRALDPALGRLADAAAAGDAQAAAGAQHEVSVASVSSDSRANQIAERNAVRAYDRKVKEIGALSQQIAAERNRLQVKLGS